MKIGIFQIYYREEQKGELDSSFEPYFNGENDPYLEYGIMKRFYESEKYRDYDFCGFVSWRFHEKTLISGEDFRQWILSNPGHDVYFVNPFFEHETLFGNVWKQGDHYHPGIADTVTGILEKTGLKMDLKSQIHDGATMSFCNYWVGSPKFWEEFFRFTLPVYRYLENDLTESESRIINSENYETAGVSNKPFIMERMLSTLLATRNDISGLAWRYDERKKAEILNYWRWKDDFQRKTIRGLEEKVEEWDCQLGISLRERNKLEREIENYDGQLKTAIRQKEELQQQILDYDSQLKIALERIEEMDHKILDYDGNLKTSIEQRKELERLNRLKDQVIARFRKKMNILKWIFFPVGLTLLIRDRILRNNKGDLDE